MKTYIIGITGASGSIYATRLMRELFARGHRVLLTISEAGKLVLEHEEGISLLNKTNEQAQNTLREHFHVSEQLFYYHCQNIAAPIASGSVKADAMIIVPCSMGTIGNICAGTSSNLLHRAADVTLKERRPLVLVAREAPYNTIHLTNMTELSRMGVVIMPASPGFYQKPTTLDEMIDHFIGRLLDQLGLEQDLAAPWNGC